MNRMNCLFWAVRQRLRYGGRLKVTRSSHPLLPRVVWCDLAGRRYYYAPLHPKRGWRGVIHALWFRGRVKRIR